VSHKSREKGKDKGEFNGWESLCLRAENALCMVLDGCFCVFSGYTALAGVFVPVVVLGIVGC